jgi:hypothetical protein
VHRCNGAPRSPRSWLPWRCRRDYKQCTQASIARRNTGWVSGIARRRGSSCVGAVRAGSFKADAVARTAKDKTAVGDARNQGGMQRAHMRVRRLFGCAHLGALFSTQRGRMHASRVPWQFCMPPRQTRVFVFLCVCVCLATLLSNLLLRGRAVQARQTLRGSGRRPGGGGRRKRGSGKQHR